MMMPRMMMLWQIRLPISRRRGYVEGVKLDVHKVTEILREYDPVAIYQFGSTARGAERLDSDVDIAFLSERRSCDPVRVYESAQRLAAYFCRNVDLIDLRQASAVMKTQVLRDGHPLYTSDPGRVAEFEMYALSDYARLNEERQAVLKEFLTKYDD